MDFPEQPFAQAVFATVLVVLGEIGEYAAQHRPGILRVGLIEFGFFDVVGGQPAYGGKQLLLGGGIAGPGPAGPGLS
ncbi:MAG: hypothetical protein K6G54_05425, partial [Oscillospiraceae bacterium]|nr:hypothetical protein [Oscillospiraceae bacterium]